MMNSTRYTDCEEWAGWDQPHM